MSDNVTIRAALFFARARIERGWTQYTLARNSNSKEVHSDDPSAVAWCVIGSTKCSDVDAREALRETLGSSNLVAWNDHPSRTKEDVLELFDKTMKRLSDKD